MESKIREPMFAKRLKYYCDINTDVPPHNYGRLSYIQREFLRNGQKISTETVRKWLAGEARPRPVKMRLLADIVKVDHSILALGVEAGEPHQIDIRKSRRIDELETLMRCIARAQTLEQAHTFANAALQEATT